MGSDGNNIANITSQLGRKGEDVSTLPVFITENLEIGAFRIKEQIQNVAGNVLIWGNPVFGNWGEFNWGGTVQTSFVLGNTGAGVLGTSKLGSQNSDFEVVGIYNDNDWFPEYFVNDRFIDTGSSTGSWYEVDENYVLNSGEILQGSPIAYHNNSNITSVKFNMDETFSEISNLVAWYKFNGDTLDSTGSNDGVVTGSDIYTTGKQFTEAFNYDGSSVIGISDLYDGNGAFSIAFWMKYNHSNNNNVVIFDKGTGAVANNRVNININTDESGAEAGNIRINLRVTGNQDRAPAVNPSLNDNAWHHLVYTYDGAGNLKLYIDNVDTTLNNATVTDGDFHQDGLGHKIGDGITPGNAFLGQLQDFRFYNRGLTSDEVSSLYNNNAGLTTNIPEINSTIGIGTADSPGETVTYENVSINTTTFLSNPNKALYYRLTAVGSSTIDNITVKYTKS